jgi:hypothetical protein
VNPGDGDGHNIDLTALEENRSIREHQDAVRDFLSRVGDARASRSGLIRVQYHETVVWACEGGCGEGDGVRNR